MPVNCDKVQKIKKVTTILKSNLSYQFKNPYNKNQTKK